MHIDDVRISAKCILQGNHLCSLACLIDYNLLASND